jgi:hypothetical protein
MRRGPWHQFGDRSQRLALEQLEHGNGVGVVISPRDLTFQNAVRYAREYRELGADVMIDQQFYVPEFRNTRLNSYPIAEYRSRASQLSRIGDNALDGLAQRLHDIHESLGADGVIAPALAYEAGRRDIHELNARLFGAARRAGDALGIPTYATVMIGRSATSSEENVLEALSHATSLDSAGWYYGFEFGLERIPTSLQSVMRCCAGGLLLACTGKPVLHAYAGPMALLSFGFGATATGIGHFQNLWHFSPRRWQASTGTGGGGDAPPRLFSRALWGTIIYPDEVSQLPLQLQEQVLTRSPFCLPVFSTPRGSWQRWDANKHLVHVVCSVVAEMSVESDPETNAEFAIEVLEGAVALHAQIAAGGVQLADETSGYQRNWLTAMRSLQSERRADFRYLHLMRAPDGVSGDVGRRGVRQG